MAPRSAYVSFAMVMSAIGLRIPCHGDSLAGTDTVSLLLLLLK